MRFNQFLNNEGYEIFGFDNTNAKDIMDRSPNFPTDDKEHPLPMKVFKIDYMTDILELTPIGNKTAVSKFFDHIQWGNGAGALRLRFGTRIDIIIERAQIDFKGSLRWITKKFYNLNQEYFGGKEDVVADDLLKELNKIDNSPPDSPLHDYKNFERLVKGIASRSAQVVNDPLFFESTKKVSDNYYIIVFGARGAGVQAAGQVRIEQVMVEMIYNPETGLIKMFQSAVESSLGEHKWALAPSNFQLEFMPSQSQEEICCAISTIMKYF